MIEAAAALGLGGRRAAAAGSQRAVAQGPHPAPYFALTQLPRQSPSGGPAGTSPVANQSTTA